MLRLWTSVIAALLVMACLASADAIGSGAAPGRDNLAPVRTSNLQWNLSPEFEPLLANPAGGWPVEVGITSPRLAVEFDASAPPVSPLRDAEPQRRLTFSILIVIALGVLLKWLTSTAFYELVSDACFMIVSIEDKAGRDRM